jgi:hypothetical protein
MRSRLSRHLQSILNEDSTSPAVALAPRMAKLGLAAPLLVSREAAPKEAISPEFNGHQYAIFLLHVDAGIEHALMVQYLFAAYSLGGPQVPAEHREMVERWQESILGIAKEEMGHLITVQNVLRLLGGPLNLDREDFPYDAAFYPFDFTFERLTLDSLAKYIYAEMPEDWTGPLADEVKKRAREANHDAPLHAVHELFDLMIEVISDPSLVPGEYFQPETVAEQASWSEWGRSYAHGARGSELQRDQPRTPDLIIRTAASREQAVEALHEIAVQGEATTLEMGQLSHFKRFLDIYVEWKAVLEKNKRFEPARPVVTNPIVEDSITEAPPKLSMKSDQCNVITAPVTFYWAHLLNVRYRLLLSALNHALHLSGALQSTKQPTARGDVITLLFSEMYKIRSLASVLVQLPVRSDTPPEKAAAGPPFQMPYTLEIPQSESDRWRWHRDMLIASRHILDVLDTLETDARRKGYVAALRESDADLTKLIDRILLRDDKRAEVHSEVNA